MLGASDVTPGRTNASSYPGTGGCSCLVRNYTNFLRWFQIADVTVPSPENWVRVQIALQQAIRTLTAPFASSFLKGNSAILTIYELRLFPSRAIFDTRDVDHGNEEHIGPVGGKRAQNQLKAEGGSVTVS
jgi:hypothetical protein